MSEQTAPINWEAVRVLAMAVGVREAARRLGISEDATRKRCQRERWLGDPETREAHGIALGGRSGRPMNAIESPSRQMSPAAAMAMEIAALSSETKLGFARSTAGVAKYVQSRAPEANLADAGNVKAAAQTAELIHGWRDQPKPSAMRLEVLLTKPETHVDAIEIEAQVTEGQWDNDVPQDT